MNIGVIGCGYAGKAIAALWRDRGAFVTGTTRFEHTIPSIKPYCDQALVLNSDSPEILSTILEENSVVYVCVAPKDSQTYEETYLKTSQSIKKSLATVHNQGTIVYLSSTSIYAEETGHWVDEQSKLDEHNPHARILIETERNFLACQKEGWNVVIFRLAEIYGPERDLRQKAQYYLEHPGAFYGDNFTNMVHVDDIAHAAYFAVKESLSGIFNLADYEHPVRKELFAEVCALYHFPPIAWGTVKNPLHGKNKRVANDSIERAGYIFQHPQRAF